MKFIDEAVVEVRAGNGGAGAVNFRREKFVPRGGPDGGDGGNGGAIVFVADSNLNTLIDFSFNPILTAKKGGRGEGNQCQGADGTATVRKIPTGTQVFHEDKLVADLSENGARWIAAKGGRGGKGNTFFKSATNQVPDYAQPGCQGECFSLRLVLKSVADVGLLGLPNAGKSTLISAVTQAHPKIADYPFTTLRPNLGVASVSAEHRFVIADIPGIIEGASEGKGLGIQFLRHVERTSVLAQLIDIPSCVAEFLGTADCEEISDQKSLELTISQFELIDRELRNFDSELAERARMIVFTKSDLPHAEQAYRVSKEFFQDRELESMLISSHTRDGLEPLVASLYHLVQAQRSSVL